ncbi:MAG TPA: beta-propeller fold lactonase family protein, partial [Acidimicrobiales bacterium]|nr:beta-propeller fold lactonase family protein [Acidimicrobiales bacterium]
MMLAGVTGNVRAASDSAQRVINLSSIRAVSKDGTVGTIPPMAPLTDEAWVTTPGASGADGTVQAYNTGTGSFVGPSISVGISPGSVAVDAKFEQVLVADSGDSNVWAINMLSEKAISIALPSGAQKSSIVFDDPYGYALVLENASNEVSVIDMRTDTLVGTVVLFGISGGNATGLSASPDGSHIYISDYHDCRIEVLKYDSTQPAKFSTQQDYTNYTLFGPRDLITSPGGDFLYASAPYLGSGTATGYVLRYSLNSDGSISTSTAPSTLPVDADNEPGAIALSPTGSTLYAAIRNEAQVDYWTAPSTTSAAASVATTDLQVANLVVRPDGGLLDLVGRVSGVTPRIETYNLAAAVNGTQGPSDVSHEDLGTIPSAIAVGAATNLRFWAYVTDSSANTLSVVDTVSNNVVTTIGVGSQPDAVAVSPDGAYVY